MKTYQIDVRQEHIDAGLAGQCRRCPVALAALADHALIVGVTRFCMARVTGKATYGPWVDLPQVARDFIADFDGMNYPIRSRATVKPFKFEIEI